MSSIKSNFIAKDFARRVKQRKTLMLPMTQLAKKLGVANLNTKSNQEHVRLRASY